MEKLNDLLRVRQEKLKRHNIPWDGSLVVKLLRLYYFVQIEQLMYQNIMNQSSGTIDLGVQKELLLQ